MNNNFPIISFQIVFRCITSMHYFVKNYIQLQLTIIVFFTITNFFFFVLLAKFYFNSKCNRRQTKKRKSHLSASKHRKD